MSKASSTPCSTRSNEGRGILIRGPRRDVDAAVTVGLLALGIPSTSALKIRAPADSTVKNHARLICQKLGYLQFNPHVTQMHLVRVAVAALRRSRIRILQIDRDGETVSHPRDDEPMGDFFLFVMHQGISVILTDRSRPIRPQEVRSRLAANPHLARRIQECTTDDLLAGRVRLNLGAR
jgi:hypothetical protein